MTDTLSPELLARYADARLPRYTSYPTAPHFSPDVGEAQYRFWLASLPATDASLYLHIPFCRAMCWYCGCHTTVAAREAPVLRYLECLRQEIDLVARYAGSLLSVRHVHFGGGTPTLMPPEQMQLTMDRLKTHFRIADQAEIAIEIDPRTFTPEMATTLGRSGFNRASIGVQTFDLGVQQAINRVQSFEATEASVRLLRSNGVRAINFDLIYGLPGQTVQSCLQTVEQALVPRPDRLAVFGYAHVPSFKPHQRKIDGAALPDSEMRFAQSRAIAEALVGAGYVEIGLDHFALPDDPLAKASANGRLHRNFQGYTTDEAEVLIGLGASSIGRMPQGFVQNEVRLPEYERLVRQCRLPVARGYRFAGEDQLRAAIIERLMCDQHVDLGAVCQGFGADPAKLLAATPLESMIADGLVEREGARLSVTRHARPLVRSIAAAFDAHLSENDRHSRAI
ncbi:oxygen-independent coproporphyrinogen III oxidase [Sphingomonas daechungensis]|uniref:oxygen-independent coproporphyrinogen III oxidase n=2 Tax=Sphingomonas daechungensis TaxID=1176646 RepID=UPI0031EE37DE